MLLTRKLTHEEIRDLLCTLFRFDYVNIGGPGYPEHWVVYDDEGNEFYSRSEHLRFDFSTLEGFFVYTAYRAKNQGYFDCQHAMRTVLGI